MKSSIWRRIFHRLVESDRTGTWMSAGRALLSGIELPYRAAVNLRNWRFDVGHGVVRVPGARIISVGNLTMGGTGKTPMVKWLAREFEKRGQQVAIVSRGYGAAPGEMNDEARELQQALPKVVQEQDADRVAAVKRVRSRGNCDVILLDDGFQHRRLSREVDIVLLDGTNPFGNGHLIPRGVLREPLEGLRRADIVCLTRVDRLEIDRREEIRQSVLRVAPDVRWCEMSHVPVRLLGSAGRSVDLAEIRRATVGGFCGIGNPIAFRKTLDGLTGRVAVWRAFPDHHRYSSSDERELIATACSAGVEYLICTHKDLVKIKGDEFHAAGIKLLALEVEMQVVVGKQDLLELLQL